MDYSIAMKKIVLSLALAIMAAVCSETMKIVVGNDGQPIGRLIKAKGDSLIVAAQDYNTIPKAGTRIVTYSPERGDGIVTVVYRGSTEVNIHAAPSNDSPVLQTIKCGTDCYEVFDCLGKVNGWYKVRLHPDPPTEGKGEIEGKRVGYIQAKYAAWDGLNTL